MKPILYINLFLLSLGLLTSCSSDSSINFEDFEGETITLNDPQGRFGTHELDIDFGGGPTGWIEKNDSGTTFANPENLDEGNPNFKDTKYFANGKSANVSPGVGYTFPYYQGEGYVLPRILAEGEKSYSGAVVDDAYSGKHVIDCSVDRTKSQDGNTAFGALKYPEGYRKAFFSFMVKSRARGVNIERKENGQLLAPFQWKMMAFTPGYHSAYGSSLYIYNQQGIMTGGGSRCCDGTDNCLYGKYKSAACGACMSNIPDSGLSGDPMSCSVNYANLSNWPIFDSSRIPWPAQDYENDGIVDKHEYEWARLWFYFDMGTKNANLFGDNPDGRAQHYVQKHGEPPHRVLNASRLRHRYKCGNSEECPDGDFQINYKIWLMNFFQFQAQPKNPDFVDILLDEVYVAFGDDAYKRVEVGNCDDYYKCTKLDMQRPLLWKKDKIVFALNLPNYKKSEPLFAHVLLDHDNILTFPIEVDR